MNPTEVQFANEKVKKAFEELDDANLKGFIERAFKDIKENPFCGIQIPRRQIPKDYIKRFDIHIDFELAKITQEMFDAVYKIARNYQHRITEINQL